jgi:hypothetical protein
VRKPPEEPKKSPELGGLEVLFLRRFCMLLRCEVRFALVF